MDTNNKNNLNGTNAVIIETVDRKPYEYKANTSMDGRDRQPFEYKTHKDVILDREPYDYSKKPIKAEP